VKPYRGPPLTLESVAAAKLRLMVWCKTCRHQSEPDPPEQARWYGPATPVPEWRRLNLTIPPLVLAHSDEVIE
jgi:hypothetical protein